MHCCAFFFLGPTPFVERAFPILGTVEAQWVLKICALFLFGTASAFAVIPTYPDMHHGMDGVNRAWDGNLLEALTSMSRYLAQPVMCVSRDYHSVLMSLRNHT